MPSRESGGTKPDACTILVPAGPWSPPPPPDDYVCIIVGHIDRAAFLRAQRPHDWGYGPVHVVGREALVPVNRHYRVARALAESLGLARMRNKGERVVRADRLKVDPRRSTASTNIVGAAAEIAAARWLGVEVDRALYVIGDPGFDLVGPDGITYDVKANHHGARARLYFRRLSAFRADRAILVAVEAPATLP